MREGRPFRVRSADGTEIHVDEFGPADRPPLVLVHAWMCSIELWHRQIEALAGEFRIIAFDLRGHGRSGRATDDDYTIEPFADDLEAVVADRLAEGERAVLAGHSMGAMTIAAWAHRHPDSVASRCDGVALIGTGLGDLVSESLVIRAPQRLTGARDRVEAAMLCSEIPFDDAPEFAVRAGVRFMAFGPDARDDDVALVARMVRACPRRVRGRCGGTLSRLEVHDGLAHLDVPAVVIAGGADRMTPPAHSHKLAKLLPASPEPIEATRSGHMVPLEADELVTAGLRGLRTAPEYGYIDPDELRASGGRGESPRRGRASRPVHQGR
jgi:pimeloyl-ACP methyl ester carboxylesterase